MRPLAPRAWRAPTSCCSGGEAALYVERGGRSLLPLRDPDPEWLRPALTALVEWVRADRGRRLSVERFDGRPVVESDALPLLVEAGFLAGPRRAVLRPVTRRSSETGRSPRIAPLRFPCRTVYGSATPPRRRVVRKTPAIPAASSATAPAPAPKDVQSMSLPPDVAVVATVRG